VAKPYLSPDSFRLFAHRGLTVSQDGQKLDENSQPAFEAALAAGATYLEVDVRASRDGVSLICHDETLLRVAGQDARVADLDWAELSTISLLNGSRLMSLEQLLVGYQTAKVNIDIKSTDAAEPTAEVIVRLKAQDRVLVSSFSEKRRLATTELLPGVATSGSAKRFLMTWLAHKLGSESLLRKALIGLDALQIPIASGPMRFDTEGFIRAVREQGVELHYWTINDPALALELRARGANGVVSDRIDLIAAALAE
jgi:glycerophosphoryl diester phosphodiesterase